MLTLDETAPSVELHLETGRMYMISPGRCLNDILHPVKNQPSNKLLSGTGDPPLGPLEQVDQRRHIMSSCHPVTTEEYR